MGFHLLPPEGPLYHSQGGGSVEVETCTRKNRVQISGYRYYRPRLGRWITRDPVNEVGFLTVNLSLLINWLELAKAEEVYQFIINSPIGSWDFLGLLTDSPSVSFLAALARGAWSEAWCILEVTASDAGRAIWLAAYARAVGIASSLSVRPAIQQINTAWHIVRPSHNWCRLPTLVNNVPANALNNFPKIQKFVTQAWNQGTIQGVSERGAVIKDAVIQGQTVRVIGRVMMNGSGVVEISNAWVMKTPAP